MIVLWFGATPAWADDCPIEQVTLPANVTDDAPSCEGSERPEAPPAEVAEGIEVVRTAWAESVGTELPANHVGWTDWGYVSLPFDRFLTLQERAAVQQAERMATEEQREKATSALGPPRHGGVAWTHFLGADPRFTDFWGKPHTVAAIVRLASGWYDHCVTELSRDPTMNADTTNCTLQVGDIAYFGPVQPDPLGHYDHYRGECTDLRLFRTDGSRYEAYIDREDDREGVEGGYNGPLTKAFVAYALDHAPVGDVYFNDPAVYGAFERVQYRTKHDDHVHMCFPATVEPESEAAEETEP